MFSALTLTFFLGLMLIFIIFVFFTYFHRSAISQYSFLILSGWSGCNVGRNVFGGNKIISPGLNLLILSINWNCKLNLCLWIDKTTVGAAALHALWLEGLYLTESLNHVTVKWLSFSTGGRFIAKVCTDRINYKHSRISCRRIL